MNTDANNPGLVWLEGQVSRVVWASPDVAYAVLRVLTPEGETTVVGPLGTLAERVDDGEFAAFEGRFEEHAAHGRQFRAVGYLQGAPRTLEGIKLYLECVPGIGPTLASRIVDHFQLQTLTVLGAQPWRLVEVKGIKSKAKEIATRWSADERSRSLTIRLRGLGLGARTIERIRRRYGERAPEVVERDPYRLAEEISGIGFKTADALARAQGLPAFHPGRVRAAVAHVLDEQASEGHCYLPREMVRRLVTALDVPIEGIDAAIDDAASTGRIVVEPASPPVEIVVPPPDDRDRLWSAALYGAECRVAAALQMRACGTAAPELDELVRRAERFERVTLDDRQRQAVQLALGGGVVVITGGPGTGKTTLVKVLLRAAHERNQTYLLASPTGRAAKRLEEATGAAAKTLHRLLEFNPGSGFQRDLGNPLEADGLVVDEVSMVDLPLFEALLEAIPADRRFALVLVGDADQLPSVGPGQVLRDLIASGRVPTARLTRIFRQGAESGIVRAATCIHDGQLPQSGENSGATDFFLLSRDDTDRAVETIVSVVAERLAARGFDPMADVQVLAPTRRGALGTESLNRALQARLNPDGAPIRRGDREFRTGDRVMCVKNRYDVEVFNGDTGRVIGADRTGLEVEFDGRRIQWGWDDLPLLDLAYAVTVHKGQGSEYPAVVLALHSSHGVMLRRNLFYTAVTRAKRFLCVVGSPKAWVRAVASDRDESRFTALAERLAEPPLG